MVNYFIYAKDFSGSTEQERYYHRNGLKTLNEFKNDVENIQRELSKVDETKDNCKIVYLHWGDKCFEVSEEETIRTYKELIGWNMNSEPGTIVDWINSCITEEDYKIKLLYIITDGQIDYKSTRRCFQKNQSMQYETVVFHALNEYLGAIKLSVAASFLKQRCFTYCNYELIDDIHIGEEFDYDKITVGNFQVEKDNLRSYIRLRFVNTQRVNKYDVVALQAIEKLKKLRKRLFDELSTKPDGNLDTKDRNAFIVEFQNTNWFRILNTTVYDTKIYIENFISTLITYIVSEKKSFSFDALTFDTKFQNTVAEEVIVDVDFAPEQEIEFPGDIILDDDKGIPVIILTQFNLLDKIIFHKTKESGQVSPASFNKFKSAMECPLFLVNDRDISESIGYFYTLNVFKQFLESSHKTEPRTRRPFHGGLVLSDTHHFDKYNDYILSATYFDSKKINYNIGLFYYVLWKNCENKEWMDKKVVEQLKQYVMRRISETVCKIGLSSLPLDPQQDTSLLTALWYCVELSSLIFKHDPLHYTHERLRMYYGVAHYMIEILKHFNYDLDLGTTEKRIDLLRHVMSLKRIPTPAEKAYFVLEKIFKNDNGFLVSEIDKPFNINNLNYLKLNHKGMLRDDIVEESVNLSDYAHFMHFVGNINEREASIYIVQKESDKTFRPCFTIDRNKSFYTELAKVTKKIIINSDGKNNIILTYNAMDTFEFDKILSLYNLYIEFVINSQKYPTLLEFIEFISVKKKFRGNLVTIFPSNVYNSAVNVFEKYQEIVTKVDVRRFIEVCKSNVSRFDRIKAEEVVKFNDDAEIIKFIFSEETKVNLKRD